MERHLQGAPATLSMQVSVGGVDTDPAPDTATVRVVRDDGTELQATTAATDNGTGGFTLTLTPVQTAQLDRLTAYWTVTVGGQATTLTTVHEVVGGFLFTIGDLMAQVTGSPTVGDLARARTRVEHYFERTVGYALVPRYDSAWLDGKARLRLRPELRRIRWATTTMAGVVTSLTPADIANLSFNSLGFVEGYRWPSGIGTVRIGYEHGWNGPEEPLVAGGLELAAFYQQAQSSTDPRAERLVTDDGTLIFGPNGVTPLPSVNAVLGSYRRISAA